jgi:hypothetical protein
MINIHKSCHFEYFPDLDTLPWTAPIHFRSGVGSNSGLTRRRNHPFSRVDPTGHQNSIHLLNKMAEPASYVPQNILVTGGAGFMYARFALTRPSRWFDLRWLIFVNVSSESNLNSLQCFTYGYSSCKQVSPLQHHKSRQDGLLRLSGLSVSVGGQGQLPIC